jgi:hypothetical protein
MPIGNGQPSIAEQIVLTVEKPFASHGGIGDRVRKSTHDFLAHHVCHTRIDDATGLSFVESPDHAGGD